MGKYQWGKRKLQKLLEGTFWILLIGKPNNKHSNKNIKYHGGPLRPFSKWAGQQIERVCKRNDQPRLGKPLKPPWEKQPPEILYEKVAEESMEMVEAYHRWLDRPTQENVRLLQWELADLAATAMMLSGNFDPIISELRRGKIKEPKWVGGKIPGKEIKGPPPETSIGVDNMKSILKGRVNDEGKV